MSHRSSKRLGTIPLGLPRSRVLFTELERESSPPIDILKAAVGQRQERTNKDKLACVILRPVKNLRFYFPDDPLFLGPRTIIACAQTRAGKSDSHGGGLLGSRGVFPKFRVSNVINTEHKGLKSCPMGFFST